MLINLIILSLVISVRAGQGRRVRLAWNETWVKEFADVAIEGAWIEWHKHTGRITRQELYKNGDLIEKRN